MENKTFNKIEISVIKSTAKNVAPFVAKKAKVDAQIADVKAKMQKLLEEKLQKFEAEKAGYQAVIDSMNAVVKRLTGGYTTEDLIDIKKESVGVNSETGKEIFKTVYALKYPETVIPVTTESADSINTTPSEAVESVVEGTNVAENTEVISEMPEDEMPEELMQEQAEVAAMAEDVNPFEEEDPFIQ